jgi:hypothetical protein
MKLHCNATWRAFDRSKSGRRGSKDVDGIGWGIPLPLFNPNKLWIYEASEQITDPQHLSRTKP